MGTTFIAVQCTTPIQKAHDIHKVTAIKVQHVTGCL